MSRTSTCSWLPRLLQSFNMYRPVVQVVQTDNLPNHIERHGRALRINPRIHTWVKPKNMSEMMHSGGPDFSPLEGFECTVGDSVVISRPTMSLNISTLLRIQNLTKSNFTVSTPSSMVRSNGTGLMLRCAAASSELSSSFLLNWESVVCGAMKLTTTPNLAKHLAKMMKGVLCPAAGKGITTTCTPMGGAITSIAGGGLSRFFHSRIGYGHTPAGDAAQLKLKPNYKAILPGKERSWIARLAQSSSLQLFINTCVSCQRLSTQIFAMWVICSKVLIWEGWTV